MWVEQATDEVSSPEMEELSLEFCEVWNDVEWVSIG